MSISISDLAPAAALALALVAAPASAQKMSGDDVRDVAETPLEDLNLSKDEIAQVLIEAAKNPYVHDSLATCNDIVREVARLDMALGADYDLAGEEDTGIDAKSAAKSVVGSIMPFRGLVREITGAAGDKRKAEAAVRAGMVRRGYLKGLGQGRGCEYPARPRIAPPSEPVSD
jgi:hypothetical protein